jgi:hypothetical protein
MLISLAPAEFDVHVLMLHLPRGRRCSLDFPGIGNEFGHISVIRALGNFSRALSVQWTGDEGRGMGLRKRWMGV